jgi:hypothetical protein
LSTFVSVLCDKPLAALLLVLRSVGYCVFVSFFAPITMPPKSKSPAKRPAGAAKGKAAAKKVKRVDVDLSQYDFTTNAMDDVVDAIKANVCFASVPDPRWNLNHAEILVITLSD